MKLRIRAVLFPGLLICTLAQAQEIRTGETLLRAMYHRYQPQGGQLPSPTRFCLSLRD